MPGLPQPLMPLQSIGQDLVSRATSLLAAEGARLEGAPNAALGAGSAPDAAKLTPALAGSGTSGEKALDPLLKLLASAEFEQLRRRGSAFLEALLEQLARGAERKDEVYADRVPLIRALAPVQAGAAARVLLRVTNDESCDSIVSLYASNFIADNGYEIPSLRVTSTPRSARLVAGGEATFEIKIMVPEQAPAGLYSALVQAAGSKYVKAVVMIEVL